MGQNLTVDGHVFDSQSAFVVPTEQVQYRMVQNAFETYDEYVDSVFYDASAWSLVNFYGLPYAPLTSTVTLGPEVSDLDELTSVTPVAKTNYAYLISGQDYHAPALLHHLVRKGLVVHCSFKPFTADIAGSATDFGYGTLMVPVQSQEISSDSLHQLINEACEKYQMQAFAVTTGYSLKGVDLGSRHMQPIDLPKVLLLVGDGVSSYEAGEVWHLMDTRVDMPITKLDLRMFDRVDLDDYTTLVMVTGSYHQLDSSARQGIKRWIAKGNTLITIRGASAWAVNQKLVKEGLVKPEEPEDKAPTARSAYGNAREELGREQVGGAIFKVSLDLTHPLAFGYRQSELPVYRNSNVWLKPSENAYCTVADYTADPHIDGFITEKNMNEFLVPSASLIVSGVGSGRVILFADNPNFRGSWYGTNRLFLNAVFLGAHIQVPQGR